MTSLTRTDTARSPGGMAGGSPDPASADASFMGRIGSFWMTGSTMLRPITSFGSPIAPAGTAFAGQSMIRMSSRRSSAPMSRSAAATTTGRVGIDTVRGRVFCTKLYVPNANAPPALMASTNTMNTRIRAIRNVSSLTALRFASQPTRSE